MMKKPLPFVALIIGFLVIDSLAGFAQADPLTVNPDNPRYFTDGSGKAIYLTGSHTWANLVTQWPSTPVNDYFDYIQYLNNLEAWNHNFIRMWALDYVRYSNRYTYPFPYNRGSVCCAVDGGNKFDLDSFNQAYFDRLLERVEAANDRGIYVSVMMFDGFTAQRDSTSYHATGHVFHEDNNEDVMADVNDDNDIEEFYKLTSGPAFEYQKAYVEKVIDTVQHMDNVLYEIANEAGGYSTAWQNAHIDHIKAYEIAKGYKKHPVGFTFNWEGGSNSALRSSNADWISPTDEETGQDYLNNPPINDGTGKVVIADTDHICVGPCAEGLSNTGWRDFVWKNFMRGNQFIFMDAWEEFGNPYDDNHPGAQTVRENMGYALRYAEKINLADMLPSSNSYYCETRYCLRNPGSEYLVYQPGLGPFDVNVQAGTYDYEWFNPATGNVVRTGTTTFATSGTKSFDPQFSGDAVLLLSASGTADCGDGNCIGSDDCISCPGDCDCNSGNCRAVAEGGTAALSCSSGDISSIGFASYGTPEGECGSFSTGSCHAADSKPTVESRCLGQPSCDVPATNTEFGDPCSGVEKRLYIEYSCSSSTPTCYDGTPYSACVSGSPPQYCNSSGQIVDSCGDCGCPSGQVCSASSTSCEDEPVQPPGPVDCTGLILLHHLDEDRPDPQDSSDLGNHGSCSGSTCPVWSANGKFTGAFSFDGSDDFLTVPDDSSLDGFTSGATFSFWMKFSSDPSGSRQTFLSKYHTSDPGERAWLIEYSDENGYENVSLFFSEDTDCYNKDTTDYNFAADTWYYIVVQWIPNSLSRIWVDGVEETDMSRNYNACGIVSNIANSADDLYFGKSGYRTDRDFEGAIDEVAIWNRLLSDEEVADLYSMDTYIYCGTLHRADTTAPFGCVDSQEINAFMNLWYLDSTTYPMEELMEAVGMWKQGTGC